jgi:hypothetical protein
VAFIQHDAFTAKADLKTATVKMMAGGMQKFNIPTSYTVAGVYTVDLVSEVQKRIAGLPDAQVRDALAYFVNEASAILKSGGTTSTPPPTEQKVQPAEQKPPPSTNKAYTGKSERVV